MNKINVLDISKIAMYEYWYDSAKQNYGDKDKLCHMYMYSFKVHVKSEDLRRFFIKNVYEDLAVDAEQRFDTSNYEVERPLPVGKNKNVIGLMRVELGRTIMKEFLATKPKMYSYLMVDVHVNKRTKNTKKCVIKKEINFEDYKTAWKTIRQY